jgi:hypothetical protein
MSSGFAVIRNIHAFPCVVTMVAAALLSLPQSASATGADAAAVEETRRSSTRQIPAGGREGSLSSPREDEYGALRTVGTRSKVAAGSSAKTGGGETQSATVNDDFWFFTADVELFNDDDRDGYFHGIDLLFDVDTFFEEADVYAVAYLSFEGGPWNEYANTDTFTVFGATSDDEFVIVTELETGYPTGNYDLLIELYDAVNGVFLASIGPEDSSELALLPLEDFQRDEPFDDDNGGSAGVPGVAVLLGLLLLRAFKRRPRRRY